MMRKFSIFHFPFTLYERGFTFIELIVAFSVIAILSTVGIASFVSYSRSQQISASVRDLVSIINLAKSRSASQVKPDVSVCDNTTALEGYDVRICGLANSNCVNSFPVGSYGYELNVKCSGNIYSIPNYNKQLPDSVSFDSSSTTASVFFPVISGGIIGSGNIVVSGYGQTKTITVSQIGNTTTQ